MSGPCRASVVVVLVASVYIALSVAAPRIRAAPEGDGDDEAGTLARLWDEITAALAEASRARTPPLRPPTPVEVRWRSRRAGSVDLGSPILDLATGDLDGDGAAELLAVTENEVAILRPRRARSADIVARAPLPDELPAIRPRDPVGEVVAVVPPEPLLADTEPRPVRVLARSSSRARIGVYEWSDAGLVAVTDPDAGDAPKGEDAGEEAGFPICADAVAALAPGRNYYEADTSEWPAWALQGLPARFWTAECTGGVDAAGRPVRTLAVVGDDGSLVVHRRLECRDDDEECLASPTAQTSLHDVGYAFEIADLDNDGAAEAVVTTAWAPGASDRVTVLAFEGGDASAGAPVRLYRKNFTGGVVAVAAGDLDGDGDLDLVAAVRLVGSDRFDLWTLN